MNKNANKVFNFFYFFHTHSTAQGFRDNQIASIQTFEKYSKTFKNGAKILINTKVIKILLTTGLNEI